MTNRSNESKTIFLFDFSLFFNKALKIWMHECVQFSQSIPNGLGIPISGKKICREYYNINILCTVYFMCVYFLLKKCIFEYEFFRAKLMPYDNILWPIICICMKLSYVSLVRFHMWWLDHIPWQLCPCYEYMRVATIVN